MEKSAALSFYMRYYTEPAETYTSYYGQTYTCDHPVYQRATLYLENGIGLCVVQQRFNARTKATYWSRIDPWLVDAIYTQERFHGYFIEHAKKVDKDGLYPTVPIRKLMWALRMKPLKKERWETTFDRAEI